MNKMNENRKIVLDTLNEQNIEYEMFEHQAVYTVDEIEDSRRRKRADRRH